MTKETFDILYKILDEKYQEEHKWGGRPSVLSVLDKLVIFCSIIENIALWNISLLITTQTKSTVCDAIHWAEEILITNAYFIFHSERK